MLTILKRNTRLLRFLLVWLVGNIFSPVVWGQTVLTGRISEESTGKPLPEVICMVTSKDSTLIQYAISGSDGAYTLRFQHPGDSVLFSTRLMGFRTWNRRIANRTQSIDIRLQDDDIRLKEVVVKGDDIYQRGDTINYNVSALKGAADVAIVDVIKKLPGVEVSGSGKISYQGKPINKFYIEGMDLLGGKYSLATNSVPADAVASIQVLENHQPIKALEETELSERAAMNLKLKKGKKLRPVGQASLAAGWSDESFKYAAALSALRLSEKGQSLLSLKANNSGTQLANELIEHTYQAGSVFNSLPYNPNALVSPSGSVLPPVPMEYGIFNESYMGSYNQLFKLEKELEVKVNGSYLDEKLENRQEETVVYGVEEEHPLTLITNQAAETHRRQGNLSLQVTKNSARTYLDNRFRLSGDWSEALSALEGTNPAIQDFSQPSYLMENRLNYIGTRNHRRFSVHSFIRYQSQPQEVALMNEGRALRQERNEKLFYTTNDVQLNYRIGLATMALTAGFKVETNRIRSSMDNVPEFLTDSVTQSQWNYLQTGVFVRPVIGYKGTNTSLTLSFPLVWQRTEAEKQGADRLTYHDFRWTPSARFTWKMNHFWELSALGSYNSSPTGYRDLNDTYYYTNRNLLRRGIDEPGTDERTQVQLGVYYRNTIDALWGRVNMLYNHMKSDLIGGYDFVGTQLIHTYRHAERDNKQFNVRGNLGTIIDAIETNLNLNVGYTHSFYTQYQQNSIRQIRSNQGSLQLTSSTRLLSWWTWDVEWNSLVAHNKGYETVWNHKIGTGMTCTWKHWTFAPRMDYSRNQQDDSSFKDAMLLHASLTYKLKMWQLSLHCTNLLDTQSYVLRSYSGVNRYDQVYWLRPRQILARVRFLF